MRLGPIVSHTVLAAVLPIVASGLAGCDRKAPAAQASGAPAQGMPGTAVPAPSNSRDPKEVLVTWAKAISLRHWDEAYGYWGDHGAGSGMTLDQFRARWDRLRQPDLEIQPGHEEGAAGSLFYTAPVTVIDGQRRFSGEVVLRRANEVPGATPEQLRWHIESSTLEP